MTALVSTHTGNFQRHDVCTFPKTFSPAPLVSMRPSAYEGMAGSSPPHTAASTRSILSINNLLSAHPSVVNEKLQQERSQPPLPINTPVAAYKQIRSPTHLTQATNDAAPPYVWPVRTTYQPAVEAYQNSHPPTPIRDFVSPPLHQSPRSWSQGDYSPRTRTPIHAPQHAATVSGSRPYHYSQSPSSPARTTITPSGRALPSSSVIVPTPPLDYTVSIRQQPVAARACGYGDRDRRVVDPPPIIELKTTDQVTGAPTKDYDAMLAMHCTLLTHDGKESAPDQASSQSVMLSSRSLMGTAVASPYEAKDEHGAAGSFFVFADLSCRHQGDYKLRFKLIRIDPTMMVAGALHGTVATIESDVFTTYTAKDFPGMRASSALLIALRSQGLNVGIKKGSQRPKRSKAEVESESNSDEADEASEPDSEKSGDADGRGRRKKPQAKKRRGKSRAHPS